MLTSYNNDIFINTPKKREKIHFYNVIIVVSHYVTIINKRYFVEQILCRIPFCVLDKWFSYAVYHVLFY